MQERRLKMQADLEEDGSEDGRSDAEDIESEQGEFEIGVNLVQEEGNGSPNEEGSDETESEEEGEEVNQLVDEDEQEGNQDEPMEEAEEEQEEDELPMYQEHYNALFSMDFVETKHHEFDELDRAELDQGWGYITFLAKGEKKMVTFRQLEILFGFTMEKEPVQGCQIRSPVLRYVHKALANTFFARKATGTINEGEVKLLDMGIKPIISRTRDGKKIRGDRAHAGNLMPLLEQLQAYKVTAYNTRHQEEESLVLEG
ncbi:unnamed protein product [Microthlaspi erraticum]|uniref:Arabidopsis retrotransposon Orf1 C-terminal domain-containing protein n=1 Tax=Microthlaspi erraticum TaxID=1685480 RepID=A0A6D2IVN5_9BRAS|nr:unnamed protein product [Microthlaspi erraticum]